MLLNTKSVIERRKLCFGKGLRAGLAIHHSLAGRIEQVHSLANICPMAQIAHMVNNI
jgi:hypothetical protein